MENKLPAKAELQTFYILFPDNTMLENKYDTVEAANYAEARKMAYKKHKHDWSLIYTEAMFNTVKRRLRYTITPIVTKKK